MPDLETLWRQCAPDLRRICRRYLSDPADADEAFSRTAVLAVEHFPARSTELRNPRAWLIRLASNACFDIHRENRRKRTRPLQDGDAEAIPQTADGDPERVWLGRERAEYVLAALQRLPARLREVVVLVAAGRTYAEVAEALAISAENARKRMQEARAILSSALVAYEDGRVLAVPAAAAQPARALYAVAGAERDVLVLRTGPPRRQSDRAVGALRRYAAAHPRGTSVRLRLAGALVDRGEWAEAAEHYRAVLARKPLLEEARVELAMLENDAGSAHPIVRASIALKEGRVSDVLQENDPAAAVLRHDAWSAMGMESAALDELQRAQAIDPANVLVLARLLARAAEARDATRIAPLRAQLVAADCDLASAEHAIALSDLAVDRMARFVAAHPRHAVGLHLYADLLARAGDLHGAARASLRAVDLGGGSATISLQAAECLLLAGRSDVAAELAAAAVRAETDWIASCRAAEHLAGRVLDAELSLRIADRLVALEPDLPLSWLRRAQILSRAGDCNAAAESLDHAWELLPGNDAHEVAVATMLALAGRTAETPRWARLAWKTAARLDGISRAKSLAWRAAALYAMGKPRAAGVLDRAALAAAPTCALRISILQRPGRSSPGSSDAISRRIS